MKNCDQCIDVGQPKDDDSSMKGHPFLKRRVFGVKRSRSQGTLDNPARYLFLLFSSLNVSIPSWHMLCGGRVCLAGESGTRTCLFCSPETGLWFQPAVSRLALISCAHTHILAFLSSWGHGDVMHAWLPTQTANKTTKCLNQSPVNRLPPPSIEPRF